MAQRNDSADNPLSHGHDNAGRLARITLGSGAGAESVHYAHNGLGQRVFKTDIINSAGTASSPTTQNGQKAQPANPPRITLLGDEDGDEDLQAKPSGLLQTFKDYWLRLWSPQTDSTQAQGRAFVYAEDGSLLGEYPMEANPASPPTQGAQHIWLPTASGPMPIAVVGEGRQYAVHADHLNTPRRLTQEDGKVAWQWAYSAFGDERPTTAATRFTSEATNPATGSTSVPQVQYSLRYPGQYFDEESGLHYNHFRSYCPSCGRYTQADPIGLDGGFNRFSYVGGNPLGSVDPMGLMTLESWWSASVAGFQSESFGSAVMRALDGWPVGPAMIGGFGRSLVAMSTTPAMSVMPDMAGPAMCAAKSVLFRGGYSLEARLGVDVIAAADGLIHPFAKNGKAQGLSLNLNPLDKFIQQYGGAFPVNSLPDGLQALQSGKAGHFVISPVTPMSFEKYQQLLNQVQIGNFNRIP